MKKFGKFQKRPAAKQMLIQTYITSLICLMLCVTMFFGTTAAWFTSEVESVDNEIYVGILKVDLQKKVASNNGANDWVTLRESADAQAEKVFVFNNDIKWEPNAMTIETLKVVNDGGDLAFQYRLNLIASETNTADTNAEKLTDEEIQAIASQFDVYMRNETPTNEVPAFNAPEELVEVTGQQNGWTRVGTLAEALAGKVVFDGSMDKDAVNAEEPAEHIYAIALHMKSDSTGMYVDSKGETQTIMGKKLYLNVKLVATQTPSETDEFVGTDYDKITEVINAEELKAALEQGGNVVLMNDIEIDEKLEIKEGIEVYLDMNGNTLTVNNPNPSKAAYCFVTGKNSTLTIDGNGTVDITDPMTSFISPGGDVIIENGTFIRNVPEGSNVTSFFVGVKVDPWGSQSVIINGGYFDGGYYDKNASDVDDILAGTKVLEETDDDIAKRGNSGDKNPTRVAIKNNVMALLNLSYNLFNVYGGTFVGANPAWGDEGCMMPTTPNYLRPWSYYQGALIEGQEFHEDGIVLPEGFSITKGQTEDGRPTYTVNYNK